jgi:hypothetical protein
MIRTGRPSSRSITIGHIAAQERQMPWTLSRMGYHHFIGWFLFVRC